MNTETNNSPKHYQGYTGLVGRQGGQISCAQSVKGGFLDNNAYHPFSTCHAR